MADREGSPGWSFLAQLTIVRPLFTTHASQLHSNPLDDPFTEQTLRPHQQHGQRQNVGEPVFDFRRR